MEQELCMTRIYWVEDSTQSVWKVCRTLKTVCSRKEKCCSKMGNSFDRKPCK